MAANNFLKCVMSKENAEQAIKDMNERDMRFDRRIREVEGMRLAAGLFDLAVPQCKRL